MIGLISLLRKKWDPTPVVKRSLKQESDIADGAQRKFKVTKPIKEL